MGGNAAVDRVDEEEGGGGASAFAFGFWLLALECLALIIRGYYSNIYISY